MQNIEKFKESCPVHAVTSGVIGFAFGGFIGLFLSSLSAGPELSALRGIDAPTLPLRTQLKMTSKDMGSKSFSTAKNFGMIGMMFSGIECVLETYRAKKDIYNTMTAGCASGGILSAKGGPKAALFGCAGFAAFSSAIEYFLQERNEDD